MKKVFLFIIIMFVPFFIKAEELKIEWENRFGGSSQEIINDYVILENEDMIFCGYTFSVENMLQQGFLVKYDKDGNLLWQKYWGGSKLDSFAELFVTNDGDILVSAFSSSLDIEGLSNKGDYDAIIVKYDKDGNLLWQKSFGGNGSESFSVFLLSNEDILMVGHSDSTDIEGLTNMGKQDIVLFKLDKDGNILWKKSWGGNDYDYYRDSYILDNNYIILCGHTSSTNIEDYDNKGKSDAFVLKYDLDGNLLWKNIIGGEQSETFPNIYVDELGNSILYTISNSSNINGLQNNGRNDIYLVKYDKDGNLLWQNIWGGNLDESIVDKVVTNEGNVILCGYTKSTDIEGLSNKGESDAFILKYDKDGNLLWQNIWGGSAVDQFDDISVNSDDHVIVSGYTYSIDIPNFPNEKDDDKVVIFKFDEDGNVVAQNIWGGNGGDEFIDFYIDSNDNVVFYGMSQSTNIENFSNNGESDAIVVKYDKNLKLVSQKNYGGIFNDVFRSIIIGKDDSFILGGSSSPNGQYGFPGDSDVILVKFSFEYDFEILETKNGNSVIEQYGSSGVIRTIADKGYELDKIIVKNINDEIIEVTKMQDGTYSFPLSSDVSVEVLFKEKLSNPKTGVLDYISFIMVGMLVCVIGYISISFNNQKFEL